MMQAASGMADSISVPFSEMRPGERSVIARRSGITPLAMTCGSKTGLQGPQGFRTPCCPRCVQLRMWKFSTSVSPYS